MGDVAAAGGLVESTLEASNSLALHVQTLAEVIRRAGTDLQEAFADISLSKDLSGEARSVAEVFVAWREVGEAQVVFAGQLLELCVQLRRAMQQGKAEHRQRLAEAGRLQSSLAEAEARVGLPTARGWFGWFGDGQEARPSDAEGARQKLEGQRALTAACTEQLVVQLEMTRQRCSSALGDTVGDVRRHAKAIGERVSVLRPSWRGSSSRASTSGPTPPADGKATRVSSLIRTLATAQGRRQAEDAGPVQEKAKDDIPVMMAPPVQPVGAGEWRIRGIYEHQVLKAGLRQLEMQWPSDSLDELPRAKDGSSALFRERLMLSLLSGKIKLQSVPNSDVSAAQGDVRHLSLRQMLRLRVLHLDFTPSGCGADTVHAVGATHEAFLAALDSRLFQHLGERATANLERSPGGKPPAADAHRLGREAVLLSAAAAALTATPWWCWWISSERRVFFDAAGFSCSAGFPQDAGGVLEVTDFSKSDHNQPTGRLRWLDWHVHRVEGEKELADAPRRGDAPDNPKGSTVGSSNSKGAESGASGAALPAASGAGTAALVTPTMLRDLRGSLRKTGSGET